MGGSPDVCAGMMGGRGVLCGCWSAAAVKLFDWGWGAAEDWASCPERAALRGLDSTSTMMALASLSADASLAAAAYKPNNTTDSSINPLECYFSI